jgi:hypothetical protein
VGVGAQVHACLLAKMSVELRDVPISRLTENSLFWMVLVRLQVSALALAASALTLRARAHRRQTAAWESWPEDSGRGAGLVYEVLLPYLTGAPLSAAVAASMGEQVRRSSRGRACNARAWQAAVEADAASPAALRAAETARILRRSGVVAEASLETAFWRHRAPNADTSTLLCLCGEDPALMRACALVRADKLLTRRRRNRADSGIAQEAEQRSRCALRARHGSWRGAA